MAGTEGDIAERSSESSRVTRRQGIVVVLVLTAIAALVILDLAFSTSNTSFSVDGRSATSSQYLDPGNPEELGGD